MPVQTPVLATPLPPAPSTNDPDNFDPMADARMEAEGPFGDQLNALALNMYNNATEAQSRALQAQQAAADAQSAAAAAAASTTAVKWVAGNYADGVVAWSPISRFSYRRIGDGASATDPALDAPHWVLQLYALGLGGMVITGSVDLNVTSGGAISVTPATPGLYITLPDTTTLTLGAVVFHAFNAGVYDIGVKNKAGVVLGWIRPGTSSVIGLASNATLAGTWVTSNLHKLGVTAMLNVPSIASMGGLPSTSSIKRITLDASRTLILFGPLYGVVYDATTQTWGSPVLIRSMPGGIAGGLVNSGSAILISTDKVLVVTAGIQAVVLSISGTAITVGTPVTASATGAACMSELIAVGGGFAFAYASINAQSPSAYVRAITVTGTTPVFGNEVLFSNTRGMVCPVLFVSGAVLRAVALDGGAGGAGNIACTPYTLSGANLVAGTGVNNGSSLGGSSPYTGLRCFQNGNGNIVVLANVGSVQAWIFKLTGTTEACSGATVGVGSIFDYVAVSGTKTAIVSCDGSGNVYYNVHVDSAGTSQGGAMSGFSMLSLAGNVITNTQIAAIGATGSSARFALYSPTDAFPQTQLQFDCSGSSPVLGNSQSRWHVNTPQFDNSGKAPRHFSVLSAGGNQYAIGGSHASDGCFSATDIKAFPSLGENCIAGVNGSAANESWIMSGASTFISSSVTSLGTTLKRIEAAA